MGAICNYYIVVASKLYIVLGPMEGMVKMLQNPYLFLTMIWIPPSPNKKEKSWIFQWMPKILKFFILNPILSFKNN